MANNDFLTRRDGSVNNVPTVGYNEGADAQDVILFGILPVEETLTATNGRVTLSHGPVSTTGDLITVDGVLKGRNYANSVTALSGSTTLYVGNVDGQAKTVGVYTNAALSTPATGSITVRYNRKQAVTANTNGALATTVTNTPAVNATIIGTPNVNVSNLPTTQQVSVSGTPNVAVSNTPAVSISGTPTVNVNGTIPISAPNPIPVSFSTGANINVDTLNVSVQRKLPMVVKFEAQAAASNKLAVQAPYVENHPYFITKVVMTTEATTPFMFWFEVTSSAGTELSGLADMWLPITGETMTYDFGEVGLFIDGTVGNSLRVKLGSAAVNAAFRGRFTGFGYYYEDNWRGDL